MPSRVESSSPSLWSYRGFQLAQLSEIWPGQKGYAISRAKCRHLMPRLLLSLFPSLSRYLCVCFGMRALGVTDKLVETSNSKHAGLLATCAASSSYSWLPPPSWSCPLSPLPVPASFPLCFLTQRAGFAFALLHFSSLLLSSLYLPVSTLALLQPFCVCVCFNYIKLAHVASCT